MNAGVFDPPRPAQPYAIPNANQQQQFQGQNGVGGFPPHQQMDPNKMAQMGAAPMNPMQFNPAAGEPVQQVQQGGQAFPPIAPNNHLDQAQQFQRQQQPGMMPGLPGQPIGHPFNAPQDQRMRDMAAMEAMQRMQQPQPQPIQFPNQRHVIQTDPRLAPGFDRDMFPPAAPPPQFQRDRAFPPGPPIHLARPGALGGPPVLGLDPREGPVRIIADPTPGVPPFAARDPFPVRDMVMSPRPRHRMFPPPPDENLFPPHIAVQQDPRWAPPPHPQYMIMTMERTYGYPEFEKPYPTMVQDVQLFIQGYSNQMATVDPKHLIDILAQRTPAEMAAFRRAFRDQVGTNVDYVLATTVLYESTPEIKLPYLGLALGNINFDIYLIENAQELGIEAILPDIFVGRTRKDLMLLDAQYRKLHPGSSLATDVETFTSSESLGNALRVITELSGIDPYAPLNMALVNRDVEDLIAVRESGVRQPVGAFSILFRRPDPHLRQVFARYSLVRGIEIDKDFRTAYGLSGNTRSIIVHQIRSILDPTYRDCMLIKDAIKQRDHTLLAVRVTRMHWYPQHWTQVKASWMSYDNGQRLIDRMNRYDGLYRDLMVTMAQVPICQ